MGGVAMLVLFGVMLALPFFGLCCIFISCQKLLR